MSGDSPHSELFPSRFSTPVNELDDHRFQPESLPRADTMASHRRGTAGSTADNRRPTMLQVPTDLPEDIRSRDFEQAVFDDEKSDNGSFRAPPSLKARRGSVSPVLARKGTFKRPLQTDGVAPLSRSSSKSSKSSHSHPNSVEAFAEPRARQRAGTAATMQSLDPAAAGPPLRQTTSNSTFTRARTFSQDRGTINEGDDQSDQGSVEDDVCFPQTEETEKPYNIDYDDLNEFVEKSQEANAVPNPMRRKESFSCRSQKARVPTMQDKKEEEKAPTSPRLLPQFTFKIRKSSDGESSDAASVTNEKKPEPEEQQPLHRWSFFSSELEESIHAAELGDLLMPGETFQRLFELGPDGGCWWLDMLMPTEDEVEVICKAFGIHGLTREDIIQQETREKVELFKSYYFVCFRSFYQMDKTSEDYLEPVNVYAVVFREGILTFTFRPSPHASNVRKRMGRLRDYVALGADWICYALIDDIVDTFGPVITEVEQETDTIEDSVYTARTEDSRQVLRQIGECRKKVMSLLRLLGGKADVIKGFAKRCNEQYSVAPRQDVGLYLSDIQDHVVTMMGNLGHSDHMLSRSHANYLAQISVENITQGNRANEVLSKVTFVATILVPLNLVCGLFGMNVKVPGREVDNNNWFYGILGCLGAFVVVMATVAKFKKFI